MNHLFVKIAICALHVAFYNLYANAQHDENNSPDSAEAIQADEWLNQTLNVAEDTIDWFRIHSDRPGRMEVAFDLTRNSAPDIRCLIIGDVQNREEDMIRQDTLQHGSFFRRRFDVDADRSYYIGVFRRNGPDGDNDYRIYWHFHYSPLISEPTIQCDTLYHISENFPFQIDFTAFHIEDNIDLQWRYTATPRGSSFEDFGDGSARFNWRPGYDQGSPVPYVVAFIVSDADRRVDTVLVSISVMNVNRTPIYLGGFRDYTIQSGDPLHEDQFDNQRFVLEDSTSFFFYDPDTVEGDRVNYLLVNPPQALNLQINPVMGTITAALRVNFWQTTPNLTITVRCRDMAGLSAYASFQVQVLPVNDLPALFTLYRPVNNARVVLDSLGHVAFSWHPSSDVEDSLITYRLKFAGMNDSLLLDAKLSTSLSVPIDSCLRLLYGGGNDQSFRWSVWAYDGVDSIRSLTEYTCSKTLSIESAPALPESFSLSAFPNPFNSTTTIRFSLSSSSSSSLRIYDLSGRLVTDLTKQSQIQNLKSQIGKVTWDAGDLPVGIYFVKLTQDIETTTQKIVLLK